MSEYASVKLGRLKFKGEKSVNKDKKRKHKKDKKERHAKRRVVVDEDAIAHGGWWRAKATADITGAVAIQFDKRTYIRALDNGLFTLGAPHEEGEPPLQEEIFTAFPTNETKVAFKSGYGKYLGVERNGEVTGRSDAVGPMEQWEPVFEAGKMALLGANGCFMAVDPQDDAVVSLRKMAGDHEFCIVRSNMHKETETNDDVPTDERGDLAQVEINFVKKFQKFQDKKLRINEEDKSQLEAAKIDGVLHEALLDRRSKMKADRYCK